MMIGSCNSHFANPIMMCLLGEVETLFPSSSTYSIIGMLPSVNRMRSG